MSYLGNNQPPPYGEPLQGGPPSVYSAEPGKRRGVVLAVVGVAVAVGLAAFVGLSRVGVIDSGPFARKVPSVLPPSIMPAQAGGLYRLDDDAATYKPDGAKFDWAVAWYYSPKPPGERAFDTPVYVVTIYGPLKKAKDAIPTRKNIVPVGAGVCADGDMAGPIRECAVQRGSIVATVVEYIGTAGRVSTDDGLVGYATAFADTLS
ncbi:hypothetical protein EV138_0395 [Kribbella voronezhensis]|uniref:Uncharacterized protein n=1 Tax=Kribbella voronezhensis TaxID=2512212 RepID=A0A4R7T5P4_9ACTN|nr:hypothetical protein EV138_0395 [Kribbella voronezhensis]